MSEVSGTAQVLGRYYTYDATRIEMHEKFRSAEPLFEAAVEPPLKDTTSAGPAQPHDEDSSHAEDCDRVPV